MRKSEWMRVCVCVVRAIEMCWKTNRVITIIETRKRRISRTRCSMKLRMRKVVWTHTCIGLELSLNMVWRKKKMKMHFIFSQSVDNMKRSQLNRIRNNNKTKEQINDSISFCYRVVNRGSAKRIRHHNKNKKAKQKRFASKIIASTERAYTSMKL